MSRARSGSISKLRFPQDLEENPLDLDKQIDKDYAKHGDQMLYTTLARESIGEAVDGKVI